MDIVFFGSGAFGVPTLAALAKVHHIRAIVTQPDKPAGRGASLTATPVGQFAAANLPHIPLLKPVKVNEQQVVEQIRGFAPSTAAVGAWVVIAFGQKLSQRLLADRFAVNLHASLLPRWRGAAPIHAAILGGDVVTGNSIITLADKMDAGLVLATSRREIPPTVTTGELHDLLAQDGPELMLELLGKHQQGRVQSVTQLESEVTLASKLSKSDGYIDFTQPADICRRRINGLNPWPGVTVNFRGFPLKLLRSDVSTTSGEHGAILDVTKGEIGCGQGSITLIEVQPAGGKRMMWSEFARGRNPVKGEKLERIVQGES